MSQRRTSARIVSQQTKRSAEQSEPANTNEASKKPRADGSSPNKGALTVGTTLPTIELTTDADQPILVPDALRKAVVFTYPKANTPGCTTQGQCYRDSYAQFEASGWKVFGLSADSPRALTSWKEKQSFPYPLISDPDRTLIGALTGEKGKTVRSHFVVDAEGKLALSSVGVKPKESADATLEFIQSSTSESKDQDQKHDEALPKDGAKQDNSKLTAPEAAIEEAKADPVPLKVGDALPQLTLTTDQGSTVQVPSELHKVVLFTYPKANTPGCTTQGLCYRDSYEAFTTAGWKVFGLSADEPEALKSWKADQGFTYPLLSDPKRELIGVLTGETSKTLRSHFIVDDQGKVALSSVGVDPKESAEATLAFITTDAQKANL